MAFHAVADQFRKWRRHSRDGASLSRPTTVMTPVENDPPAVKRSSSKPPAKEYPPSPDTFLNGIGDYRFIRQIGQGKFSRVMLSVHCLTHKHVAIKVIDKRAHDYRVMSRLVREINLMELLEHPNIVRLIETYETTDTLYLVMEYVEGLNLDEYLQRNKGKLTEEKARDIFRQMVVAMDYCHDNRVVHRDLKTPNILLTKDLKVKVADFGLGNRFGRRRLKTICGSMLYYSPEIINGQRYTGPEIDCWCLGVSLFRMTVGEEPFSRASTVGDLRKDVTAGNFTIPDHISPELKNTIMKCMSIDKSKRTRLGVALKEDAWLNDNGKLPDLFSASKQEDQQQEKRVIKCIKRTVVCHPHNPSIYFTSAVPHSSKIEDLYINSEKQRRYLFQKINEISCQIQLTHAQNGTKSPIRHLLRKLKQPELSSSSHPPLRKTTSNISLSLLYQRVAKDQIHYYTFEMTPQLFMQLTGSAESSFSLTTPAHYTHQDEFVMILIIRAICDIMGITYHRDKSDQLTCVMTLNDYTEEKKSFYKLKRRDSKIAASSTPSLGSQNGSQASLSRGGSSGQSDMNRSSHVVQTSSKLSKFKRMTSNVLSSMFPHHSSTAVVHDNRVVRQPPFPMGREGMMIRPHSSQSMHHPMLQQQQQQQQHPLLFEEAQQERKGGVAIFTLEILSLSQKDNNKPGFNQQRVAAIKLSKVEGSSKVFQIACGWITSVLGHSFSLDSNYTTLTNISNEIDDTLHRPKSAINLIPPSLITSPSSSVAQIYSITSNSNLQSLTKAK
ncbi:kinase-like protein [Backusella circina FSU 941]|nr:kinase-like protein [Backusella circina FSU 941]